MTFPTAVKKSGPLTISKTGSGSKSLAPGSPKSPGSPQILPGSSKAPLASKAPEKINSGSSVKKPSIPLNSSTIKNVTKPVVNAKSEAEKTLPSAAKGVIKSVTKPPPLNIKVTDAKGLPSPKTPTKSSIKSQILTKSPLTTKPALVSKSTSVSTGIVRSPSITKSAQVSVTSPMTKSSQVTIGVKSSTTAPLSSKSTLTPKSFAVSSPVAKSPPVVSKTSLTNATVPKSPKGITNPSTLKSVASTTNKENLTSLKSKDQATVAKPTTPVKKAAILPVKSSVGVKSPTIPTNKPPVISKSLSTASSLKSSSLKTPTSPLKLITKEPSSNAKVSALKSINKSSVISKSNPTSSKAIVNKESSSLSLLSVKSSSTIKSTTSAVSKTSTLKANVTPLSSSSVTKNFVPKSPVAKTKPLTVVKIPSSPIVKTPVSSIVKTPSSPIVKTSLSIAAKIKTPSPSVKARTSSISLVKPPLSPAVKKMVPTKLILSPGPSKSKSLSSSRLNSVSTESLASRTSLKSPMTPRSTKLVTKSPSKIIKKTEEPKAKGIRGGQPIKKTIEIPGITELPSNLVSNQQETLQFDFVLENVESVLKKENDSTISQIPDQDSLDLEKLETHKKVENINDDLEIPNDFVNEESALSNITNDQNVSLSPEVNEHNLETIEEDSIEPSTPSLNEHKQEDICILSDFEVVKKDECVPSLNSISQSANNCSIAFDDNYFNTKIENVFIKPLDETQSCIIDIDDHFEPMNDKLVLGDVPFETDSSQEDISDNEQTVLKEVVEIEKCDAEQNDCVDDVFIFTDDLLINNYDSVDSTESFIHQFMPKSIKRSEDSSSISTDDGSLLSRKSYSEAVSGSPKDGEYYFDYDFEIVDDCLDYEDEGRSVFVEVTEKEFPELKPKDLSGKRRRNKKQKKRNYSNRTESQSDSNTEINYNPEDFDGNEFCRYIKMMKDCSFYPNGLFSSDSVKLSTSSSLSWLDISIRTTDDDLVPSTENLSTYEVFQASNLNKEFLTSIIGSNESTPTNETTWFWKSIEGKHQPHNKANITLSLQPRPKHLTTPRFMILLALISEAKGYEIKPSLSENFVTKDCMSRFDEKIRRLMVQGFWLIGRLIKESLSEDEEVNCENPFEFVDGDIGLWWAGINMLDWQEHLKECGTQNKDLPNCYQFVIENMGMTKRNTAEAQLVMNAIPDDFMSELDMENFIHTVRNVKYYSGNCFVDSQENLELLNEVFEENDEDLIEWEKNSVEKI
ncbi:uncharacterized threonine-rich GPI-anchored glycoprotein PJ4664.02-like [Rhopalosiphum maidis]|uniref:uncharacterized threonine-rich GPI-anchored glycoprotein PJ4664.02-like n=1 Tax=Rhopalosiphum maidis TaxID=43146 RepID=UPI000EFEE3EA|nr:uncharacterized threonine-rich GPI-anchored glycoprotein PJ4664.02-like [Rhopalosiphum maidis]